MISKVKLIRDTHQKERKLYDQFVEISIKECLHQKEIFFGKEV